MPVPWLRTAVVLAATAAGIVSGSATPTALAQTFVPDAIFLDGFEPPVGPVIGDLRITEVMPDPAAPLLDAEAEWIEVWSAAPRTIVLTGCELRDAAGGSAPLTAIALTPGAFLLAARSSDSMMNGGLQPVVTFGFTINNTNETVAVYCGGVLLDQLSYLNSQFGHSIMIDSAGTQCNADGSALYWTNNFGTPAAVNLMPCP